MEVGGLRKVNMKDATRPEINLEQYENASNDPLIWLTKNRIYIQIIMLNLHLKMEKYSDIAPLGDPSRVLQLMVGISFSLWRAVFLVSSDRNDLDCLNEAHYYLKMIIETNAIGFVQDKKLQQWSSGYYMNNANTRMNRVYEKVPSFRASFDKIDSEQPCMDSVFGIFIGNSTTETWVRLCTKLNYAVNNFEAAFPES